MCSGAEVVLTTDYVLLELRVCILNAYRTCGLQVELRCFCTVNRGKMGVVDGKSGRKYE
jgi:hypothetical protein